MSSDTNNRPLRESLEEYARGIAGGLLFSFPLLYTIEVWRASFIATPFELMLLVLSTFLLHLGYNRFPGMHPGASWRSAISADVQIPFCPKESSRERGSFYKKLK
ncbi:DUF2391 family protein [Pontibacter silvestris]|uniref:DUF2391 family protein n=1 Tax=Pontibacter silvestris TaxID=2305183 RepID=A0ABW4WUY0_9BACT|nr:DUF2391 family protein [Pontibacter silvestris]MCC9138397.1 TIGR02587 family membrane protein [Pontibacter silvestris]